MTFILQTHTIVTIFWALVKCQQLTFEYLSQIIPVVIDAKENS